LRATVSYAGKPYNKNFSALPAYREKRELPRNNTNLDFTGAYDFLKIVDQRGVAALMETIVRKKNTAGVQFVTHLTCMRPTAKKGKQTAPIPREFSENRDTARQGGKIAGDARKKLEKESGRKVVIAENYLDQPEAFKRIGRKPENGKY
jgi:hypothetical protein